MPVVNLKSTPLTNADAKPVVPNHPYHTKGMVRSSAAAIVKGASDSNGSTYRFVRVPSNARLIGRTLKNDAITGMTDVDIGLFNTDGTVVDADILEDGLSLASAGSAFAPFGAIAPENVGKRLWELLGLTQDPNIDYDIAATGNTSGAAAGDIGLDVLFVV